MKRLILITIMIVYAALVVITPSNASWTNVLGIDKITRWKDGTWLYRVKLSCASDSSDPAEFNLSSVAAAAPGLLSGASIMSLVAGSMFYQVETDPGGPGGAPLDTWTLSLDSDLGSDILDLTGLSTTRSELSWAGTDLDVLPIVYDIGVDISDIGTATATLDVYFYFQGVKR